MILIEHWDTAELRYQQIEKGEWIYFIMQQVITISFPVNNLR